MQNLNERQECQQWKQRFCLEQTEHGKLQERQLNTESELTGFKKVQGEAEFQFKEFEQTKTMQEKRIAEMQVLYLDSNERMLEAERRVAASRLMIEIVKKAKNEKIEFIH